MKIKRVYEGEPSEKVTELLENTEEAEVEEINAEDWNDKKRFDFYMKELMPLSIQNRKKIKGRVRTRKAGKVTFEDEVLIIDGEELHVGEEEEIQALEGAGMTA